MVGSVSAFASFQRGDDGEEVLAIQKRLVELNYTVGTLDGEFGPATEKAIKAFQAAQGLEVDGVVKGRLKKVRIIILKIKQTNYLWFIF